MDFGKILDQWERGGGAGRGGYGRPRDKASEDESTDRRAPHERAAERRRRLKKMAPQRQLDLHGLTAKEAVRRVDAFLKECRTAGVRKVLIVHGKGLHSAQGPVLRTAVRECVQRSPLAGEMGPAEKRWGGAGALWVVLRE